MEQLQVQDKGSFVDVESDGNCGYNSLILGSYIQNVDANTDIVDTIILDENPTAQVRQEIGKYALKKGVMKKILEASPILCQNLEIEGQIPKNLHTQLKKRVEATRKSGRKYPIGMGVNDELQGIDYLGNMLYCIYPNRELMKRITEKKLLESGKWILSLDYLCMQTCQKQEL